MNDYERIARAIRFLDEHYAEQPSLSAVADCAGLSEHHFQRLFSAWAGVSPKQFLQCLTMTHAKASLIEGKSVLESALHTGLSGPGRLHDLCLKLEAASPGEVKSGGASWTIVAGFAASPFGICLIAESPRGICHVSFLEEDQLAAAWNELRENWPLARWVRDDSAAGRAVEQIFAPPSGRTERPTIKGLVKGTEFQLRVWRALLQVPAGQLVSYGRLAQEIGQPTAVRAVGTAVGQNALAFLIPCHRVIRQTGVLGQYRWGPNRKRAMVAWERACGPS